MRAADPPSIAVSCKWKESETNATSRFRASGCARHRAARLQTHKNAGAAGRRDPPTPVVDRDDEGPEIRRAASVGFLQHRERLLALDGTAVQCRVAAASR